MSRIALIWTLLSLLGGCTSQATHSRLNESYEIGSFSDPIVLDVVERMKQQKALFVFDIDNTLLKFPSHQFVGSDQWYQWQEELPATSPSKVYCEFEIQAIGYRLQRLIETESGVSSEFVKTLQQSGNDVIAMTARGHDVRSSTERELIRNGYDFSKSVPAGNRGFVGTYIPRANSILPRPRPASYQNGIAMVAGQNKGYMIRDLLSHLDADNSYDYIVFFDDNPKNTIAVSDWFATDPMNSIVFLYDAVNVDVAQHDLRIADAEIDAILQAFAVFDRRHECEVRNPE